jgi:hypothetical protein
MRLLGVALFATAAGLAGAYGFTQGPPSVPVAGAGCVIKGNISYSGGQRIYHVPGQHYYDQTVIDPAKGARWFCSEAEAQAAGWRRAGY